MSKNMSNIADWFISGLYIVFIIGVISFAYYEIKSKRK